MQVTIHKYQFDGVTELKLELPDLFMVLDFQTQRGVPTFWIERPVDATVFKKYTFKLLPTGAVFEDDSTYEGSAQLFAGDIVLHLYSKCE